MEIKTVLELIKCHANKDDAGFIKAVIDLSRELYHDGRDQLAEYVLAEMSLIPTWCPMDEERKEENK